MNDSCLHAPDGRLIDWFVTFFMAVCQGLARLVSSVVQLFLFGSSISYMAVVCPGNAHIIPALWADSMHSKVLAQCGQLVKFGNHLSINSVNLSMEDYIKFAVTNAPNAKTHANRCVKKMK
jgi:hypothetical protein